jgi:hypothetical protein
VASRSIWPYCCVEVLKAHNCTIMDKMYVVQWSAQLTAIAKVATILGSNPDICPSTVECETWGAADETVMYKKCTYKIIFYTCLLSLKILPLTRFKDSKSAILILKMLTGSLLGFCKMIPKTACEMFNSCTFSCSQWELGTREHRPITEKGIMRRVSVSIFKIKK